MAHFIESSVPGVNYLRQTFLPNKPVNLDLCKSIEKSRLAWYPDNTGLPAIKFNGCDVEWAYHDASVRDADFERIARNQPCRSDN